MLWLMAMPASSLPSHWFGYRLAASVAQSGLSVSRGSKNTNTDPYEMT